MRGPSSSGMRRVSRCRMVLLSEAPDADSAPNCNDDCATKNCDGSCTAEGGSCNAHHSNQCKEVNSFQVIANKLHVLLL